MNLKRFTSTLAAAALAASLGGVAIAQPPEADEPAAHGRHFDADRLPRQLEALGLSDVQQAKIKALHTAQRESRKDDRAQSRALYESLRDLSPDAPNYTQEIERIAAALGQEHAQRIRDRAALRQQVWLVLTPTQQAQLAALPKPEFEGSRKMPWKGENR